MKTKEEQRLYEKKWRQENKEKKSASDKAYYQANKEKIKAYHKEFNIINRKRLAEKAKIYAESFKDGFYTVYYLPKENYIGITSQLKQRLTSHKCKGKDVLDVEIINKYKTKREALDVEAAFHNAGYLGRKKRHNNGELIK